MSEKSGPCVRVELEYQDGRVQRLTGAAAERWIYHMNALVGSHHVRYGASPIPGDLPWERTHRDA